VYAGSVFCNSLTQSRSLSCVDVGVFSGARMLRISSMTIRHCMVAFRKHVLPVLRKPRPSVIVGGGRPMFLFGLHTVLRDELKRISLSAFLAKYD